ncbi:MAG: pentapeptide repeat-containing protein [Candidatus Limnocylindrales bacterium]
MTARARRPESEPAFSLPELTAFDGTRLEPRHDYDGIEFVDLDLTGQDAADARFVECRLDRCAVDGLSLRRARILGSLIADVHGASVDLADSTWRGSLVTGGRLGALQVPGATMTAVRFRGAKIDYLNLSGAQLDDIAFEGCELGDIDARGATLGSVRFSDCVINELNVTEARLAKVDLSGSRLSALIGVDNLRGAIINHDQLHDLAPQLAVQLGIEVRPPSPTELE